MDLYDCRLNDTIRHFPFFDGTVKARNGVTLNVLQVGALSIKRQLAF